MAAPRPLRFLLAACAAWMLVHELRVVLAPDLAAGPLFSRFVHDAVVLAAAGVCLARVPSVARARAARLGADRLGRAGLGASARSTTRRSCGLTPIRRSPRPPTPATCSSRRSRCWARSRCCAPVPATSRRGCGSTASRPRSAWRRSAPRSCSRPCSTASTASPWRSPPPSPIRSSTSCCWLWPSVHWPAPVGGSTGRGCCLRSASRRSGSPTRCSSSARPRAPTSRAAGSTSAGGRV